MRNLINKKDELPVSYFKNTVFVLPRNVFNDKGFTLLNFSKRKSGGFTLIELLIVIAILAVLATAAVLMLNPAQMLAESNDSTRLNDIRTLDNAISLSNVTGSITDSTASKLVYISLPSTDDDVVEDCINDYPSLPPLASGWTYRCAVSNTNKADLRKIDSSGWLPINLSSSQPPLAALPIDPMNNATNYYAYGYDSNKEKYAIASVMASTKHLDTTAAKDGGNWDVAYEIRPVEWIGGGSAATFIKTFGGVNDEESRSVSQTSDGGYIITGLTKTFGAGNADVLLSKFDFSGNLSWSKIFGDSSSDYGQSVFQTSDGGYIVAGDATGFGGGFRDAFLSKYDSSGGLSWFKKVGGASWDSGHSVSQTSDGGYIVAGEAGSFGAGNYDFFLLKFDSSGNLSWSKVAGGAGDDQSRSVSQTSDGGYITTGYTQSFGAGSSDIFLLKFDSSGGLSWSKAVGGAGYESGYSVSQTSDGGYIVLGETSSFGAGSVDVFLLKFDSSGNLSWSKTIGGASVDRGESLAQTSDGGYIVAGYTQNLGAGGHDVFLLRFDSSGNILGCSSVQDIILTSSSPVPTVISPVTIVSSPVPTVISPSPITPSPIFTSSNVCPL
jgi:prepilin-type N-terminal cleavage/methylation domain-containing protein